MEITMMTVTILMICILINIITFYILQWNARSLIANGQELKKFIKEYKKAPELICIQETWLKPCLEFVIPGYECLRLDRSDKPGGVVQRLLK